MNNNSKTLIIYGDTYVIVDTIISMNINMKHSAVPIQYIDSEGRSMSIDRGLDSIKKVTIDDTIIFESTN